MQPFRMEEASQLSTPEGFFRRNWKMIAIAGAVILALVAFIFLSRGTSVSPDLVYFPT